MKAKRPVITSPFQELTVLEGFEPDAQKPRWTCWYYVTSEEEVWFGESTKGKRDISVEEFNEGLEYVKDDELYPEIPKDMELRLAPEHLNEENSYVKRPGLAIYKDMKGSGYIPKNLLDETLMMEKISKLNHPNIVSYHGVRTKRGRITSIYLENLDKTLEQCFATPDFEKLDKARFMKALRSAIDAVHGLGLAHNDLNPENIMVREGLPVLIDSGPALHSDSVSSLWVHMDGSRSRPGYRNKRRTNLPWRSCRAGWKTLPATIK